MSAASADAARWLDEARRHVEAELEREFAPSMLGPSVPERLADALRYAMLGGGKRLRPALVLLACEVCGGERARARDAALALEMVHTYSLVHDDLPCMDDDDLRRGRPTLHKRYDEALAVLAGDALLTLAFEVLARSRDARPEECAVLARAAGAAGMVGGQVLDLACAGRTPSRDEVAAVHAGKTAALFGAALELGALRANAPRELRERCASFGRALGACFQAIDDVLDVTAPTSELGKTAGKDARQEKPTLVAALGLSGARTEAARLAEEARAAARALGEERATLPLGLVDLLLERRA